MKLQDQVCTLEQAKCLAELGIVQIAETYWMYSGNSDAKTPVLLHRSVMPTYSFGVDPVAAFNVSELGTMLPGKFQYKGEECFVDSTKYCTDITWIAGIHTVHAHDKPVIAKKYFPAQTEAWARGAMLIYLLEKGYITAEEVNKRLEA